MTDTVRVDYSGDVRVASMVIGGMTVLERVLREAARAGATRAVVAGDRDELPRIPPLTIDVDVVAAAGELPADARELAGDVIAGVTIHDEATRKDAERALLQTCRRPYDGVGDRYVIRAVSLRLTGIFALIGATPNQVTLANIVVGLAACALAARGTAGGFIGAGALMFAQVVLDSCDGELSRIRFMGSKLGMWLDNVSDDVIDNLFVVALGFGLGGAWRWIGITAAVLRGMCALMIYVSVARAGKPGDVMAFRWWFDRADDELAERFAPRLTPLAVLRGLGRRDLYVLVWSVTCVAQLAIVGFGLGVAIGAGYFGLAVAHLAIKARGGDGAAG